MRVVVAGGGLAGLAAAWRLQRAGAEVTLLEARNRTGFVRDKLAGVEFEPTHTAVPASAPALFGLVRELGLGDSVRRVPIREASLGEGTKLDLASGLRGLNGLRRRRLWRLLEWFGSTLDPARPERGVRLDDRSIGDFVRLYVSKRCEPEHLLPLFESELGLDSRDTSRLLLLTMLDGNCSLRVANVHGMSALTDALRAGLDDVRLESAVASIAADGRGVELASGERIEADAVIAALRPERVRTLAERQLPGERPFFDAARSARREHLIVALREPMDAPRRYLAGGPLAALIPEGRTVRLVARGGSDEELLTCARRACPALIRTTVETTRCDAGAVRAFGIGHARRIAALRKATNEEPSRRLFFADASLVAPHAEGAVQSAERAALQVLSA
jgi:phytoene dehydrogenase-like protein